MLQLQLEGFVKSDLQLQSEVEHLSGVLEALGGGLESEEERHGAADRERDVVLEVYRDTVLLQLLLQRAEVEVDIGSDKPSVLHHQRHLSSRAYHHTPKICKIPGGNELLSRFLLPLS